MEIHSILQLVFLGLVVGGVLCLFNLTPIDGTVKKVVNFLAILIIVLWAVKWLTGYAH